MTYSKIFLPALLLAIACGGGSDPAPEAMPDGGMLDSGPINPGDDMGTEPPDDGGLVDPPDMQQPDPCGDLLCENGSVCVEGACECAEGWTGETCVDAVLTFDEAPSLWLDSTDDATLTIEDDGVSAWADKSPSGYVFVAPGATNRPRISGIRGRNAIGFDGEDDFLATTGFTDIGGNAFYTMFFVVDADGPSNEIFHASRLGSERASLTSDAVAIRYEHSWPTGQSSAFAGSATGQYMPGREHIITVQQTNESTSVWVNGEFRAVRTRENIEAISGALDAVLGADLTDADAQALKGSIGEVLVYDRALNFEDREEVERYLSRKWLQRDPQPEIVSLGNARLWLDASSVDTMSLAGKHVMAWSSRVNEHTFRALDDVDTDHAPLLRMDGIGGQPVVHFDGDDELMLPTTFLQSTDDYTVVVVGRYEEDSDEGGILYGINNANQPGFRMRMSDALGLRVTHTSPPAVVGGDFVEVDTARLGDAFRAITSRSSQQMVLNLNTQDDAGEAQRAVTQPNLFSLTYVLGGTRAEAAHTIDQLTGDIGEVIIFGHVLNAQERAILEAYLANKWGF